MYISAVVNVNIIVCFRWLRRIWLLWLTSCPSILVLWVNEKHNFNTKQTFGESPSHFLFPISEWGTVWSEREVFQRWACWTGKDLLTRSYTRREFFSSFHNILGPFFFFCCFLQYLKDEDEDLISPPNMEGNQWVTFVKQSTHLKGKIITPSSFIRPHHC